MIAILDYGMGNLRSVQKACESVGFAAELTADAKYVLAADKLILPGVGAFHDAVTLLKSTGLFDAIKTFQQQGRPMLGVCLGYQLLFDRSFEDGEYEGLGLIHGEIREMRPKGLKIPHIGWNHLTFKKHSPLTAGLKDGDSMYFVHSYAAVGCDKSDVLATTDYGGEVIAAVNRDNITGFQFHPEKSGTAGLKLLKNFLGA